MLDIPRGLWVYVGLIRGKRVYLRIYQVVTDVEAEEKGDPILCHRPNHC